MMPSMTIAGAMRYTARSPPPETAPARERPEPSNGTSTPPSGQRRRVRDWRRRRVGARSSLKRIRKFSATPRVYTSRRCIREEGCGDPRRACTCADAVRLHGTPGEFPRPGHAARRGLSGPPGTAPTRASSVGRSPTTSSRRSWPRDSPPPPTPLTAARCCITSTASACIAPLASPMTVTVGRSRWPGRSSG